MYSLRAPFFAKVVEEEQEKLALMNKELTQNIERKDDAKFLQNKKIKKNIVSKLKELDNE